ncbi:hypothetical protein L1987_08404 [Smallanthus sonchifolius]|uniref:Uncharacterized protein n=1 Tax=Smallanthus sonchifolius TaxID=185202 RepID=A0ACB9JK49_9ASTR|nr:hypothetical protein L1987_08404 [Smallanthus sonchifolius]
MAEEEELKDDILSPNTLIAWERIQLPSLPTQFQSQSQSPVIVLSDQHGGEGRWSTPPAHKEHQTSVVFPPTNHEGLNFHHQCDVRETYSEKAESPSPVSSGRKPAAMGGAVAVKWWFLDFKSPGILSCVWKLFVTRGGLLRSFNFPLIGSTALLLLFWFRLRPRRRRKSRIDTIDELLGVIKEKDERINHLLHQIARMNELLLASHHGVPMISKATST